MPYGRGHLAGRLIASLLVAVILALATSDIYDAASLNKLLFRFNLTSTLHQDRIFLIRSAILLLPYMLLVSWCIVGFTAVNLWLHKHRYAIGVAVIAYLTLLDVSGSSLNIWYGHLQGNESKDVVFGRPRDIRSDEWAINTPREYSQSYNGHGYFNALYGDQPSDMFIVKDTPVWTPAEIFRPFHWGFLLLGNAHGLAFYWSARLVFLFLVSYDFLLLLTRQRNRRLAAVGATMVAFAPFIQWWLAVNSLPEMLIATFGSIVLLDGYFTTHSTWRRALHALAIAWLAGMFILVLYPAWQIPTLYVLAALIVWEFCKFWGTIRITKKDVANLVWIIVLFAVLLGTVLVISSSTIHDTMNTVYPGKRIGQSGTSRWPRLFGGISTLFLPFKDYTGSSNQTEVALFVDLFPVGVCVVIANWIKRHTCDVLDVLLVALLTVDIIYSRIGFPDWLSKALLLSMTSDGRTTIAISIINIMLLVKGLSERTWHLPLWGVALVALAYVAVSVGTAKGAFPANSTLIGTTELVETGLIALVAMLALVSTSALAKRVMSVLLVAILTCCGLAVNPVQHGDRALTQEPIITEIKHIDRQHSGMWATKDWFYPQLLAANGIRTANTVNVTPNWKQWKRIDPHGRYKNIYNRYAIVDFRYLTGAEKTQPPLFTKIGKDHIQVSLTVDQVHALGIDYVLTDDDLSRVAGRQYHYVPVGSTSSGLTPYKVVANR